MDLSLQQLLDIGIAGVRQVVFVFHYNQYNAWIAQKLQQFGKRIIHTRDDLLDHQCHGMDSGHTIVLEAFGLPVSIGRPWIFLLLTTFRWLRGGTTFSMGMNAKFSCCLC